MLFKSFITGNGNHLVNLGKRNFFFNSKGQMLREVSDCEYTFLAGVCQKGKVHLKKEYVYFLENCHTTMNMVAMVQDMTIRHIYEVLKLRGEEILYQFETDWYYGSFRKVVGDILYGFVWSDDEDLHGSLILNKSELISIYKEFKLKAQSVNDRVNSQRGSDRGSGKGRTKK